MSGVACGGVRWDDPDACRVTDYNLIRAKEFENGRDRCNLTWPDLLGQSDGSGETKGRSGAEWKLWWGEMTEIAYW